MYPLALVIKIYSLILHSGGFHREMNDAAKRIQLRETQVANRGLRQ